jgi:hypothetical protein
MSLYWLCYRVNGTFKGLVLLEAETAFDAKMRADLDGLSPGGDCEALEIGPAEAKTIPGEFVGVLMGRDEVAKLEKVVVSNTPKTPRAPSITSDDPAARESPAA